MFLRLCLLPLFAYAACRASDDPSQILHRIDVKVIGHLEKAMNYMCVQTVERSYFEITRPRRQTCASQERHRAKDLIARDRLRLDVAVSRGREIYSWHADNKFSSTLIDDVVRRGPIASGGFIGFLENVFGERGVRFRYIGRQTLNMAEVFSFDYSVPLSVSHYQIGAPNHKERTAFHGSFLAYVTSYELANLTIVADNIPADVGICSASNEVTYQLVPVAGNDLLLPRSWILGLSTAVISTESRNEYTGCREFSGESTIHFHNLSEANIPADASPAQPPAELRPGITLRIRLLTPIDGKRSYAGDPVEGELLNQLSFGSREPLPRGATLHGVITRLEHYYQPWSHYFLRIQFESMRSGNRTFVLRARPEPLPNDFSNLRSIYGPRVSAGLIEDVKHGLFVFPSNHLHLGKRFWAYWVTEPLSVSQ